MKHYRYLNIGVLLALYSYPTFAQTFKEEFVSPDKSCRILYGPGPGGCARPASRRTPLSPLLPPRRARACLDVAFEACEEALDANVPLLPHHHDIHEPSQWAELQLILHALVDDGPARVRRQRVAVLQAPDRQRTLEQLECQAFMWPPLGDPLLEPTAGREVALACCAEPFLLRRDDL